MTRGLHEMRKLGVAMVARLRLFYGLSGMGDVFLTCSSVMSRNFRFGYLLARGYSPDDAHKEIGMVVEGAYTVFLPFNLADSITLPCPLQKVLYALSKAKCHRKRALLYSCSAPLKKSICNLRHP